MSRSSNTCPLSSRRNRGFSLIELALVVLLISIMLTMGLAVFSAQLDSAAFSATQQKQEFIKDALTAYLRANKRLPCPEITGLPGSANSLTGRESRTNGTPPDPAFPCSSYVGTIPWLDLGLGKDIALDGYGNFITYFVSSAVADDDPDWTRTVNLAAIPSVTGFSVGSPGRFAITHNGQDTRIDHIGNPLPALAAVVLVSHGKNSYGAITEKGTRNVGSGDANEVLNTPPTAATAPLAWSPQVSPYVSLLMLPPAVTTTLVSGSTATAGTFDDIVLVIRPNDLLAPIVKDGAIKSAQAQVQDALNIAIIMIAKASCIPITHSLSGSNFLPYPKPDGWPNDPWGMPIQYLRIGTLRLKTSCAVGDTTCAGPLQTPGAIAFRVWSLGPNRTANTTTNINDTGFDRDDIGLSGMGWEVSYSTMYNHAQSCP